MISVKFDTSQLDILIRKLEQSQKLLQEGKEKYYQFLKNNVHLEGRLKEKIEQEVYNSANEPDQYVWTKDLLAATRLKEEDGKLYLYMDDKWLGTRPQATETSYNQGMSKKDHQGEGYSKNVEYGNTYINENNPGNFNTIKTEGVFYMKKTFDELLDEIRSGRADASIIVQPLLQNLSKK